MGNPWLEYFQKIDNPVAVESAISPDDVERRFYEHLKLLKHYKEVAIDHFKRHYEKHNADAASESVERMLRIEEMLTTMIAAEFAAYKKVSE